MTEDEWLKCEHASTLTQFLDQWRMPENRAKRIRKLRLIRCAAYRLIWDQLPDDVLREAVVTAEKFADGACSRAMAERVRSDVNHTSHWLKSEHVEGCYRLLNPTAHRRASDYLPYGLQNNLCDSIRDIFGNPFRPVTFDAEWRTSTAIALAKHIYESRDFSAMPILADALQDAGCDNDDVLNHCRDPQQVHVRGCWVVDGILGKS